MSPWDSVRFSTEILDSGLTFHVSSALSKEQSDAISHDLSVVNEQRAQNYLRALTDFGCQDRLKIYAKETIVMAEHDPAFRSVCPICVSRVRQLRATCKVTTYTFKSVEPSLEGRPRFIPPSVVSPGDTVVWLQWDDVARQTKRMLDCFQRIWYGANIATYTQEVFVRSVGTVSLGRIADFSYRNVRTTICPANVPEMVIAFNPAYAYANEAEILP